MSNEGDKVISVIYQSYYPKLRCIAMLKIAAFYVFLSVALGAFGAHALEERVTPHYLDVWKTASLYLMVHGISVLLLLTISANNVTSALALNRAAIILLIGAGIFSSSLYLLVLSEIKILGAITPIGGVLLLIGWGLAIIAL
jgi:uncharacterized membrane protein YgdD (TMEM256/DUF423 family)